MSSNNGDDREQNQSGREKQPEVEEHLDERVGVV